jgi:hypothetical protein
MVAPQVPFTKETAPEGALKGMETIERKVGFIPTYSVLCPMLRLC